MIGSMPIDSITTQDIQGVIEKIKDRGANDTALRAKHNCSQVFKYAAQFGKVKADPAQFAKPGKIVRKHYPTLTDPTRIGRMLRTFDAHTGSYQVKAALLLAPMLFVRPANLRMMEWTEIDFDRKLWTIPTAKTKRKKDDLIVPLALQAVKVLTELRNYTGYRIYAFPGRDPKKPMSNMTINAALKSLGFNTATEITGHGFRAMARTILHETLGMDADWIERQLDHAVSGSLGTAYNRTQFIDKRVGMMQTWANWLDEQKKTVHS
jgi:integrase